MCEPSGDHAAPETAARLARRAEGWSSVTMIIETEESPAETETLVYDYPGQTDQWVVLSAHVDGHDLAESAMDNGTGLAAVLAVTRALSPEAAGFQRGLRGDHPAQRGCSRVGSKQRRRMRLCDRLAHVRRSFPVSSRNTSSSVRLSIRRLLASTPRSAHQAVTVASSIGSTAPCTSIT